MMKNKLKVYTLALTLCLGMSVFASCGRNKDTTHDANSNGQVTTEEKNTEADKNNTSGTGESNNDNGIVGEVVTDVSRGARDIVGGVAEGARDIVGGAANGARDMVGGNGMNHSSAMPGDNSDTTNGGTTRTMPRQGK